MRADDLLAERALLGDLPARGALIARIVRPLAESPGGTLLDTAAAFLDGAQGVEGTARTLIVHPNTVRYRLAGITRSIGYDLTDAHDAQTVRTALAFHRLGPRDAHHTPRLSRARLVGTLQNGPHEIGPSLSRDGHAARGRLDP